MATEPKVSDVLKKHEFTIPVTLTDRNDETGKEEKREILLTYNYDDETRKAYKQGKMEDVYVRIPEGQDGHNPALTPVINPNIVEIENPEDPVPEGYKIDKKRRPLNNLEQLSLLVVRVKDVDEEINEKYWEGVPPKHQEAIVTAILEDVFPSLKTSVR